LGDLQRANDQLEALRDALDELAPGLMEQIREEKMAQLSDEERAAVDIPEEELTEDNYQLAYDARVKVAVSYDEVAQRVPAEHRDKAVSLAAQLRDAEAMVRRIQHYRNTVNYDYWEIRCAAEQTEHAINARNCIYQAKQAQDDARLEEARKFYEEAWGHWRKVFDQYPRLMDDVAADDLILSIRDYERLMQQLDEEIPADFPLIDFVKLRLETEEEIEELYKRLNQRQSEQQGTGSQSAAESAEEATTEPDREDAGAAEPAEATEPGSGPAPVEAAPEAAEPAAEDAPADEDA
jgi:hypothetical protein